MCHIIEVINVCRRWDPYRDLPWDRVVYGKVINGLIYINCLNFGFKTKSCTFESLSLGGG